jgi:hypothetical protein
MFSFYTYGVFMSSIFLSHSHTDKPFARRLASDLRRCGHIVWIDEAEILIGDSLIEKIREGIDSVDFVAAILSSESIDSAWVKKELDLASNREIDEKRVVVLPILLDDVELPGFLKGKCYADFRDEDQYQLSIDALLKRLGPANPQPELPPAEMQRLKQGLAGARAAIQQHTRELKRHKRLVSLHKSPELRAAIDEANEKFPEHKHINEIYAFEVNNLPVTLDYILWSIDKSQRRGSSPLELGLTLDNKWPEAELMIEAYADFIGSETNS